MIHISSGATLGWRIFLPVFWFVFFGIFLLTISFGEVPFVLGIPTKFFRIFLLLFYILSLAVMYRTVWQLKRIDVDQDAVYVSDYFKNFRYNISDIEKITPGKSIFRPAQLHLKDSGSFGKVLAFLPSRKRMKQFLELHPHLNA